MALFVNFQEILMDTQAINAKLSEYDFIVVLDTSGSMGEPVKAGQSRTR